MSGNGSFTRSSPSNGKIGQSTKAGRDWGSVMPGSSLAGVALRTTVLRTAVLRRETRVRAPVLDPYRLRMDGDLDEVVRHYERGHEEERLVGGIAELELVRTREVLRRHLPAPPARILDVGGGTGVHAAWLLADGYDVHLVDLTPGHVDRALGQLQGRGLTGEVGDARQLGAGDASYDAVLVLGPLYHLHERADRVRALAEARRVVRPGGVVAAAAISRFASMFDGLVRGFLFEPEFRTIARRDLADGRHANPDDRPHWFTTAYFHRPEELADEMASAGLTTVEVVGVEGLAGWLEHLDARWADDGDRAVILEATRLVESEPSLLGLSAHLLAVARRVDG
jgi:ubiquinone/menaquinone biosynthesis C-methylase UbiE